jgi:hypothetical protein
MSCRANCPASHNLLVRDLQRQCIAWDWLARLLEGASQRAVLIVNAARADPLALEA